MARIPTPEQAVELARAAQEARISSVRVLATSRQHVTDVQEDAANRVAHAQQEAANLIKAAELEDVRAYDAALAAGWSPAELRKIGLPPAAKTQRVTRRRRAATTASPDTTQTPTGEHDEQHPQNDAGSGDREPA